MESTLIADQSTQRVAHDVTETIPAAPSIHTAVIKNENAALPPLCSKKDVGARMLMQHSYSEQRRSHTMRSEQREREQLERMDEEQAYAAGTEIWNTPEEDESRPGVLDLSWLIGHPNITMRKPRKIPASGGDVVEVDCTQSASLSVEHEEFSSDSEEERRMARVEKLAERLEQLKKDLRVAALFSWTDTVTSSVNTDDHPMKDKVASSEEQESSTLGEQSTEGGEVNKGDHQTLLSRIFACLCIHRQNNVD